MIVQFQILIEISEDDSTPSEKDCKAILSDLEGVIAKRNYDLFDSDWKVIE